MGPLPALQGWRVLELATSVAGRMCGRLFAACGAEVLRAPDDAPPRAPGAAAFAQWLDQNKRVVASDPAAIDLAGIDLVIAGPDKAAIAAAERLIAVSGATPTLLALPWFDENGPYAGRPANDALMQAMTGVAYCFGRAEGPPVLPQGHAPQIVTGLVGYIAAVAALLAPRGRRPGRIDANVFEAALCFAEPGAVGVAAMGGAARRLGVNRFAPTYPCAIYRASDDWVGLTALTPSQWRALCALIGRPELGNEPRFRATLSRLAYADEIDALLEPIFKQRTRAQWIADGAAQRIPITPVVRPGMLPQEPHWRGRGSFAPLAPDIAVAGPALPFHMDFDGATRSFMPGAAPLAGIRVIDFSMGWAGPLAGRMLADLGADVIKVESESHPDWWRSWEGKPEGADDSVLEMARNFLDVNRGKRGVLIDLATVDGLAAGKALVASADMVIENLGPGVMARLGLGQDDQRRLSPGVISVTMGAFGATGPLSGVRAYGSTVEQASGMPFINGEAAWPPSMQHVAYGDPVAGLFATAALLTALAGRGRLGGAAIDLGQVECLFQLAADAIVAEQALGAPVARTGSRRVSCAPCCVVAALGEDQWIAIAPDSDGAWRALCAVIARGDLAADPSCQSAAARLAQADRIEAAIADWARTRAPDDAVAALVSAGVGAARVTPAQDVVGDPQLKATDFWVELQRPFVGAHLTGATPFRYDGVRPMRATPAPTMGQHTSEVLAELKL